MARVAIVTGGTRGIGEAISLALKDMGMTVAANYAGNDERAKAFTDRTGIKAFKWDVGDYDAVQEGVKQVEAELGAVDVVVNNAGITRDGTLLKMDKQAWNEVIDTNLGGCFTMAKAVFPGMKERGWGRIVNIGSINGQAGQYGQVNYAAAKSGIHGFTKALAQEGAIRHHRQCDRAGLYRHRHGRGRAGRRIGEDRCQDPGRPVGSGHGNRARRRVPGGGGCRVRDRLDAVDQRRPAYVLTAGGPAMSGPVRRWRTSRRGRRVGLAEPGRRLAVGAHECTP